MLQQPTMMMAACLGRSLHHFLMNSPSIVMASEDGYDCCLPLGLCALVPAFVNIYNSQQQHATHAVDITCLALCLVAPVLKQSWQSTHNACMCSSRPSNR